MIILIAKQVISDCTTFLRDGYPAHCPMCGASIADMHYRDEGTVIINHRDANHQCRMVACQKIARHGQPRTIGFIPCDVLGVPVHVDDVERLYKHHSLDDGSFEAMLRGEA